MSDIRFQLEAEFDASAERAPEMWADEVKRRDHIIDYWVAYESDRAARSIHLNRYHSNPAAKQAILELREATDKAMRILNRDRGRR